MGFKVQQLNTQIKENLEKVSFCKDNAHFLQPIYIMLQVGTITYLMITAIICILHCLHWEQRENRKGYVFRRLYTSYTAYLHKGTNRHTSKTLSAANVLCCAPQKTWVHCVHCVQKKIEKATCFKDHVHCLQPFYIILQVGQSHN